MKLIEVLIDFQIVRIFCNLHNYQLPALSLSKRLLLLSITSDWFLQIYNLSLKEHPSFFVEMNIGEIHETVPIIWFNIVFTRADVVANRSGNRLL